MDADETSKLLAKAGFQRLSETSEWQLKAGGRYFFTRSLSSIVAFAIGANYKPGNGFHSVGAHTDRCKLRPIQFLSVGKIKTLSQGSKSFQ